MNEIKKLQDRARKREQSLREMRKDARYQKVIGKLIHEKLLFSSEISPSRGLPTLEDVLWVGSFEPRVLELLPAILLRRPKMFLCPKPFPGDLLKILQDLKKGRAETPFRGIFANQYAQWVSRLGKKEGELAVLCTYRLRKQDRDRLSKLQEKWGLDQTNVIRRALKEALSKD